MSGFFGSALTDRTGKFNRQDDFANLKIDDASQGYDFEDTYDGLGDQLEEDGDAFNDDTFGGADVGKDFDFSGRTAKVADTLDEEQLAFQRRQPISQPLQIDRSLVAGESRPNQTGYNNSWNARAPPKDIWSVQPGSSPSNYGRPQFSESDYNRPDRTAQAATQARKFQTLEEVEAAMLTSSRAPAQNISNSNQAQLIGHQHQHQQQQQQTQFRQTPVNHAMHQQQQQSHQQQYRDVPHTAGPPGGFGPPHLPPGYAQRQPDLTMGGPPVARQPPPGMQHQQTMPPAMSSSFAAEQPAPVIRSPQPGKPVASLKDAMAEDEVTVRAQQQKNLRRAQKIGHMARYNGLMSNGDKNYVLKVQISQLVSEDPEADDFYYTVHSTLRGRNTVQQGLGHFEQTYLSRAGQTNRRGNREKQNPMLKMQQQVQKIIASAKSRPKSTSLSMEGSLGKLSFSRVRQPKQVLNIKMPEGAAPLNRQSKKVSLQNIETVYNTLLLLEHTGRQAPAELAPPAEHQAWTGRMDDLTEQIWSSLHIMDEVDNSQLHPFIQLLQYAKGKKLVPRLYRTLSPERRLTLMTMIVAHLDMLDVVRLARYDQSGSLPRDVREEIDLFTQTVLPPLLVFASNAPMKIVVGLLNMLLERNNIHLICMSKVGLSFMTMFVSRAEIAKQAEQGDAAELEAWHAMYNRMFSTMEGNFSLIFPPPSHHVDEIYPWQFLAACAVSASPEQQHALVNEARDRVLDNVQSAKGLPKELADIKRGNVNLFLNAIGLDASQLEG